MNKRILLADDSLTIQKVVELTFMDESFDVDAVASGDEAIASLEEALPDILIADVHMPGPSGYEVCRRAKGMNARLPVLLLVGTFEAIDEDEIVACGAERHLKKPFDSQELLQLVQQLTSAAAVAAPEEAPAAGFDVAAEPAEDDIEPESGLDLESEPEQEPEPEPEPEPEFGIGGIDLGDSVDLEGSDAAPPGDADDGGDDELALPGAAESSDPEAAADEPGDDAPLQAAESEAPELEAAESEDVEPGAEKPVTDWDVGSYSPAVDSPPHVIEAAGLSEPPIPEAPADEPAESEADHPSSTEPPGVESPALEMDDAQPAAPAAAAADDDRSDGRGLSEADVERVARRVVELLADDAVREVAWDVIPDMAEIVIKDRIRELEAEAD